MRGMHEYPRDSPVDVYGLHLFRLVAETGRFTRAGRLAGLTQRCGDTGQHRPTWTRQMPQATRAPVLAPMPARAAATCQVWVLRWCIYSLACWSVMCVPGTRRSPGERTATPAQTSRRRRKALEGEPTCRGQPTAGLRPASGQPRQPPSRLTPATILIAAAQGAPVQRR